MLNRVKQFLRALFAKVSAADRAYIEEHLGGQEEQELFFAMDIIDMRHALNVAYTAEKLAATEANIDKKLLVRAALLHDTGRIKGDLGIIGKTLAVLFEWALPKLARKIAAPAEGLPKMMYVYFYHGELGAEKLRKIGLYREAELAKKHHDPPKEGDSAELCLLRIADNLN